MEQNLTGPEQNGKENGPSIIRIGIKTLIVLLVINVTFGLINPTRLIGKISLYNVIVPGRERLPFGEEGERSFNISLFNLDSMMESLSLAHEKKNPDEYRVFFVGDSSVWGILLKPEHTLAGVINESKSKTCNGLDIRAYNLGYPSMSLMKDLMLLEYSNKYSPDLIVWLVTLESFPRDRQLESPVTSKNPWMVNQISEKYDLSYAVRNDEDLLSRVKQNSIVGQRRALADLIRLQMYGFLWAATGIDHYIPEDYQKAKRDLSSDEEYYGMTSLSFSQDNLAFDILSAGIEITSPKQVIVVNEPIMISSGINSDIRYNYYYPRWVYDEYREMMQSAMAKESILYLDYWDLIEEGQFTNTSIHLSPQGSTILGNKILDEITAISCE